MNINQFMAAIAKATARLGDYWGQKWWMMGARTNGHLRTDLRVCV